jgi:hypothetical protein
MESFFDDELRIETVFRNCFKYAQYDEAEDTIGV